MLNIVVMAGGRGTRFWPKSTEEKPKQFLNLYGDQTMLRYTINRLLSFVDINHIFVCTTQYYSNLVKNQIPELPINNIIIEPLSRNTAPCILLSTLYVKEMWGNSQILVLPSDHIIENEKEFINVIESSYEFISHNKKGILTLGIKPSRVEVGYGYIQYGSSVSNLYKHTVKKVLRFVEKPSIDIAQRYIDEGNYLWNAGMFMFDMDFMIKEYSKYYSSYHILANLPSINSENYIAELYKQYINCEAISVDYAVMEKSNEIYVIASDFGWDDIGSWEALGRYIEKDSNDNVVKGSATNINASHNIIYSDTQKIILLDIDNVFCIESNGIIVVGNKKSISKVHELRGMFNEY